MLLKVIRNKKSLRGQLQHKVSKKKKRDVEGWDPTSEILWLHTGSVLLNIKCSGGNPSGGYREGRIESIIGDSNAGKTILVFTGLAHAANDPKFDNYRLIIDDAEEADSFDHEELFGTKFAERLEPPGYDKKGQPQNSETVEMFSDHIQSACDDAEKEDGRPFIYVLDSLDAIDSDKEIQIELANRKARAEDNLSKIKDSYQASKQKYMSKFFRQIRTRLKKTRSFLIIICQTRDNLQPMGYQKQTVSGGRARKFYSSIEAWITHRQELTKTVKGIKYGIGVESSVKISKNKFTGKKGSVPLVIYPSYGVDDIVTCVDYLLEVSHWSKKKTKIIAPEFNIEATPQKLIEHIESKASYEKKLYTLVAMVYNSIEDQLKVPRKKKFD